MNDFTLDDLAAFSRNEKQLTSKLKRMESMNQEIIMEAPKESVDRILAFSKAYSHRNNNRFGSFQIVLN